MFNCEWVNQSNNGWVIFTIQSYIDMVTYMPVILLDGWTQLL